MDVQTATAWEEIADATPEGVALVQGDRRVTWARFDERAARLAAAFEAAGLRPGDRVGIDLYNSNEWPETFFAALKARLVPVSINYRYVEQELEDLLRYADVRALVYHASMAERVATVVDAVGGVDLLVGVADGTEAAHHPRAVGYEATLAAHAPAPRRRDRTAQDRLMAFTGGTTGLPRGVLYYADAEQQFGALRRLSVLSEEAAAADEPAAGYGERARRLREHGAQVVAVPCSPLMHATAVGAMHAAFYSGGTLVMLPSRRFDAVELLQTIEAEAVTSIVIVGDAFARPMLDALDEAAAAGRPHHLDTLRIASSSGLMFSSSVKDRLLAHVPELAIVDSCGSAEGAHYGTSVTRLGDDATSARFVATPGLLILGEDGVPLPDRAGERGLLASPVGTAGYFNDDRRTAEVFRTIAGGRYVVPGDYGVLHADGTVTLLGRGTSVVNTGGEKVHPEEVEEVIRSQPEVVDCIVLGTPDDRLGQVVSAVVSLRSPGALSADDLAQRCRQRLAAYKVPRRWTFVDEVPRHPNGKSDFPSARALLAAAG